MDKFLCETTNTVITYREARIKTAKRILVLPADPDRWSEKVYQIGKMRRIHSTARPTTGRGWIEGYEERNGQLYQTWELPE